MNIKFTIQRVLLTLIIITLLVIALVISYYYQHYNLVESSIEQHEFIIIPERSKQFMPAISKMMVSQDMQCEKMLYTDHDEMQLKLYWKLVTSYVSFHREGVRKLHSGSSSDVRTLTWYCSNSYLCDGLGYRFIGMTVSLMFAMFSNRVLLLRWDKTSAENTYLLPNMIDWRYLNYSLNGSFKDLGSFHERKSTGTRMKEYVDTMIKSLVGNTKHIQLLYNQIRFLDEIVSKLNSDFKGT